MKLFYSPTSPYVRKVMIMLIEVGLRDHVTLEMGDAWNPETPLLAFNPLSKVPAMELDGGEVLYDSPVICEYVDSLHDGTKIFPPVSGARWQALRLQALGDGIMDAAVLRMRESMRSPEQQSQAFMERQAAAVARALDSLEDEADTFGDAVTIGTITIGCALGYLDLRYGDENWRKDHPALADWFDGFSERASMIETQPKDAS